MKLERREHIASLRNTSQLIIITRICKEISNLRRLDVKKKEQGPPEEKTSHTMWLQFNPVSIYERSELRAR